nr:MAG TPA: hypothetical protein [Caudoviricetes sp.]
MCENWLNCTNILFNFCAIVRFCEVHSTNTRKCIDKVVQPCYTKITVEGKCERLKINPKGSMNDEQKLTGR